MSDMTSAAAIDLLDNLIGMVDDNQGNDYDSALHMAIDALKAQADSDTISRQAAIDVASGYCHPANIAKELEKLPSAQPQRKTGKWIDRGWSGDGRGNSWHEWECSECKHITKGAKWDFCPNCGADMREPEDIPMEYFESGGR